MPQEQVNRKASEHTQAVNDEQVRLNVEAEASMDVLDSILDDISTVLETNAQEYVDSFVQKGGQ
ncbi:ubiquitin-like protein Pup [Bifidobacterium gallicum]|uniref:Prokaryotic ubiquitin-like protein Pup n=1 Tax=Bifidobacterium gallicum DSM 20093 = LMG 11596 TaxID=561180 RepID=D1NU93_9BIFI|nr:ubiquitin-like protein Pup [Bifidobacterium gallicum]EFA23297.1 ubiquitin-like protein Pup [Bifidobacterium gallicum DSM 20093 = LMG 11596]KFI58939.1 ubiquitin [Bifidobacterium gallicum DSM 20093 = LMG 11596]